METLYLILDIMTILSILSFTGILYFLVLKLGKYENELEYLKSVLSQTTEICSKTSEDLKNHVKTSKVEKRKAYFQGVNSKK